MYDVEQVEERMKEGRYRDNPVATGRQDPVKSRDTSSVEAE